MREVNMESIRSIDRAIDVLQAFSIDRPSLSIDEIVKATKIPQSTVYRILYTLERRGMIQFDEKTNRYAPGIRLLMFSSLAASALDLTQQAQEELEELHVLTGQTVLMAVPDDDQILYVYKKEKYEGLKFSSVVGQRRPFNYGVLGPVMLAYFPERRIEAILNAPIPQHTPHTVLDKDRLRMRLKQIQKERVYVESNETNIGVTGIGAPIFSADGSPIAGIGIVGSSIQIDPDTETLKAHILQTSKSISARLGYRM